MFVDSTVSLCYLVAETNPQHKKTTFTNYYLNMASYICDVSKELPSRETFGILAGKEAMYKGHHCTHRSATSPTESCSDCTHAESCNKPSAVKAGKYLHSHSLTHNIPPFLIISCSHHNTLETRSYTGQETFGVLEGKDVLYFGGGSQGENLMNKWSSEEPQL